jgi:4-amino-4-deoxy-L-arabinose transferase-like glycosyltransferase
LRPGPLPQPFPHGRRRETGPGWLLLLVLILPLGFAFLGSRGLGEPDEGRYVTAASEMLASGSWLLPTLHGAPHPSKPPLTYWLVAAGLAVWHSEWGARAFLGVCHVLTSLIVARLGASMLGGTAGRVAGLVYATTLFPFVSASLVTTDALLTLWETAALALAWSSLEAETDRDGRRRALGAWILLGLGAATKGPPALVPVLVTALLAAWSPPARERIVRRLVAPAGIAAFALLGLTWPALLSAADSRMPGYFFSDELVGRLFGGVHRRNTEWWQPLKLYLPAFTLGALPWCLTWRLPVRTVRTVRTAVGRDTRRLLWLWCIVPVLVFSLVSSRQMLYVLPAFPAVALLTTFHALDRRLLTPRHITALAAIAALLLIGLRAGAAMVPSHRDARSVAALVEAATVDDARIVVVGRPLHALGFYIRLPVSYIPLGEDDRPSYWSRTQPQDELDLLLERASRRLLLVVSDDARGAVARTLSAAGRTARVAGSGLRRSLLLIDPVPDDAPAAPPRVAVTAAGGGILARHRAVERVARAAREARLGGALILTDSGAGTLGRLGALIAPLPGIAAPYSVDAPLAVAPVRGALRGRLDWLALASGHWKRIEGASSDDAHPCRLPSEVLERARAAGAGLLLGWRPAAGEAGFAVGLAVAGVDGQCVLVEKIDLSAALALVGLGADATPSVEPIGIRLGDRLPGAARPLSPRQ